jgi:FixJ family two-component response regulator
MMGGRNPQTATRERVLLVDDEPAIRRSLQLMLQAQGFAVRAFASGAKLLADGALDEASCIIADYRLADGDGLSLIAELRARGWTGAAILITGYPAEGLQDAAAAAGVSAVIAKPFREHVLIEAIRRSMPHAAPPRPGTA